MGRDRAVGLYSSVFIEVERMTGSVECNAELLKRSPEANVQ